MNALAYIKKSVLNPKEFFLGNKSTSQTILKNTFWLSLSELISRTLKLILIIFVARVLGATEYGKFTFALAFVSLFVVFADFGISSITTRELAKDSEKEKDYFSLLSLKIFLGTLTAAFIIVSSFFITADLETRKIIWILGFYIITSSFCNIWYAFFRARQQMEYEAWGKVLQAVIVTSVGMFILFFYPTPENLSFAYLAGVLAALVIILLFFQAKSYPLKLEFNKQIWKKYLALSWPLALGAFFVTLYNNIDSTMMGYFGQITQTGWYNAAYKVVAAALIPLGLLAQAFYPALSSHFAKRPKEDLQRIWNYYIKASFFIAVPILVGGVVLAPRIIDFLYGKVSYGPSVLAFQLLMIMAGLLYLSAPLSQILIVHNYQNKTFWVSLTGAAINIILNAILIPKYSLYGAAITTIITCLVILFMFYFMVRKLTPIRPFHSSVIPSFIGVLLSSIAMYFILFLPFVFYRNVLVSVTIGAVAYFSAYFVYQELLKLFQPKAERS